MTLKDVNPESLKKVSNQELLNLHYRTHQLYTVAKKQKKEKFQKFLISVHTPIMNEMLKRGMVHKTDLLEGYLRVLEREGGHV